MSQPEMYPLTDNPTYETEYETFADLVKAIAKEPEGLNHIASWMQTDDDDEGNPKWFGALLWMPRIGKTSQFGTSSFTQAEVDHWIENVARPRIARWYGFKQVTQ